MSKEYTAQEVLDELRDFNQKYPEAAHSYAHIVFSDYNLGDSSIKHCQQSPLYEEWLQQAIFDIPKQLPAKGYNARVSNLFHIRERIWEYLVWLTGIPEEIREQAEDLAHGQTEVIE